MDRRWLTAFCVCGLIGVAGCAPTNGPSVNQTTETNVASHSVDAHVTQPAASPLVGSLAPELSLSKIDGTGSVSLKSLLGKEPIILNAWASWCGPCNLETPDLVKAAKEYAGQVQFVGVNMTSQDSVSDAKGFVQKYHVSYTVLMDSKGEFFNAYRLIALPTTFVLSPSGKVIDAHLGGMTKQQLDAFVQEALKSKASV